jgi:hypothetical protein
MTLIRKLLSTCTLFGFPHLLNFTPFANEFLCLARPLFRYRDPDEVSITDMEEAEPNYRQIVLERAVEAQFIGLGQNGTRPFRSKNLSSGNSSKSM